MEGSITASTFGILFASVKYDPDLINTQYAGILYANGRCNRRLTVWRHSTDTFDVYRRAAINDSRPPFSGIDASGRRISADKRS